MARSAARAGAGRGTHRRRCAPAGRFRSWRLRPAPASAAGAAAAAAGPAPRNRRRRPRRASAPSWSRSMRPRISRTSPSVQVAELERAVGDADQAVDVEAEMARARFLTSRFLPSRRPIVSQTLAALDAVERRLDRAIEDAVDRDAVLAARRGRPGSIVAVGAHAVAAQPAGRGQLEHAREAAVIGEEQQALGVDVEPADGDDARQVRRAARRRRSAGPRGSRAVVTSPRGLWIEPEPRALARRAAARRRPRCGRSGRR